MQHIVRPCRYEDMSSLIVLFEKHAAHEGATFDPTGKLALLEQAIFDRPQKLNVWIVEKEQIVVGYYSYTFDFSTWDAQRFLYLDCLYLEAHCRGLGIGKQIFQCLINIAMQEKCVNIQWQTPFFNTDAIAFYSAIGAQSKQKARFTLPLL